MATYYIGADVHNNNTELAIEQRGKIVAGYSVPTKKQFSSYARKYPIIKYWRKLRTLADMS